MKTSSKKSKGFTLLEMIIAMSVGLLITAGVLPMYVQFSKVIVASDLKFDSNADLRGLTNNIVAQAREADAFILYDNFSGSWIDGDFVNFRDTAYHGLGRLRDGESGRFLVLLHYGPDLDPHDDEPAPIEEIVGLYLDADEPTDTGSIRMFINDNVDNDLPLEENIPLKTTSSSHRIIVDEIQGKIDGDIFYNFSGRSIIINGQILNEHGSKDQSDTYNFTITPR